jgi:uncharacterized membrane protein YqaE (UPF0057 family)
MWGSVRFGHGKWNEKSVGKKSKVSSAFSRQKIVEGGLVQNVCSSLSLSASDGRLGIFSSVKFCSQVTGELSVVTFERGSRIEKIEKSAFSRTELKSIMIPSSVVVLGKGCFSWCNSLESVQFESDSRLERIEEFAFRWSELRSIVIPSSVVILGKGSFSRCNSLESVRFESDSRLERIEESAFWWSGLKSIVIPSSVVVLGKGCFSKCKSLESITFESDSRSERIEDRAFHGDRGIFNQVKSIVIPASIVDLGKESFMGCG